MSTMEDLLGAALRTEAVRFDNASDRLPATVARGRRLRRRRIVLTGAVAVTLVIGALGAGARVSIDHRGDDSTGAGSQAYQAISPSPLSTRVHSSEVSLGSSVFIWGGEDEADRIQGEGGHQAAQTAGAAPGREPAVGKGLQDNGAVYSSATNSWRMVPTAPLSARLSAPAVLTSAGVLVVGGSQKDYDIPSLRDGALYDPTRDSWSTIPDAPLCVHLAAVQGPTVFAAGTSCDAAGTPAFATYDLVTRSWSLQPAPAFAVTSLLPYDGTVAVVGESGAVAVLGPTFGPPVNVGGQSWSTLTSVPGSSSAGGSVEIGRFIATTDGTHLLVAASVFPGNVATRILELTAAGWNTLAELPLVGHQRVAPPDSLWQSISYGDGLLVWHGAESYGVSWFDPATGAAGLVHAQARTGTTLSPSVAPLVPVGAHRFLWWGGHTGERIPGAEHPLSAGALLTLG